MKRGFVNSFIVILLLIWYDEHTPIENIIRILTLLLMAAFAYFCFLRYCGNSKHDTEDESDAL